MDNYETVVGEIRAEMARRRLTQGKMANRLGHNQQWVSRRLSGEVPMTLQDFLAVCGALDVEPDRILSTVTGQYLAA